MSYFKIIESSTCLLRLTIVIKVSTYSLKIYKNNSGNKFRESSLTLSEFLKVIPQNTRNLNVIM